MRPEMANPPEIELGLRYDRTMIALHWLTAGLVVVLWLIAQIIDDWTGQARVNVRSIHITLGVVLVLVLIARAVWRFGMGRVPPDPDVGVLPTIARLTHVLLYVLLATTLMLGLVNLWARGDSIFGLFSVPSFAPGDRALRRSINGWHGTAANAILIVAGFHAAAALFHHFVLRDDKLVRMFRARE